jgi:hypothetical protein
MADTVQKEPPYHELDVVWIRELFTKERQVTVTGEHPREPRVGDEGKILALFDFPYVTVEGFDTDGRRWVATLHSDGLTRPAAGWNFEMREVSACVYEAIGRGPAGESVRSTDCDADKALADCRRFALRYSSSSPHEGAASATQSRHSRHL